MTLKTSLAIPILAVGALCACSSDDSGGEDTSADTTASSTSSTDSNSGSDTGDSDDTGGSNPTFRVASYNISFFGSFEGQVALDLAGGGDFDGLGIAEVIQRVNPDVLLLNEFDYDADGTGVATFKAEYL